VLRAIVWQTVQRRRVTKVKDKVRMPTNIYERPAIKLEMKTFLSTQAGDELAFDCDLFLFLLILAVFFLLVVVLKERTF